MADTLIWNFLSKITGGPVISDSGQMDLEAYEKHDFILTTTDPYSFDISAVSKITQLIISASKYKDTITYSGSPDISVATCKLDGPHIFIGQMAQDFLKGNTKLTFNNGTTEDVEIQILIGRKTA